MEQTFLTHLRCVVFLTLIFTFRILYAPSPLMHDFMFQNEERKNEQEKECLCVFFICPGGSGWPGLQSEPLFLVQGTLLTGAETWPLPCFVKETSNQSPQSPGRVEKGAEQYALLVVWRINRWPESTGRHTASRTPSSAELLSAPISSSDSAIPGL